MIEAKNKLTGHLDKHGVEICNGDFLFGGDYDGSNMSGFVFEGDDGWYYFKTPEGFVALVGGWCNILEIKNN